MPRFGRPPRRIRPLRVPGRRRPFGPLRPLAPGPIRALARANRMFAEGQFAPAAEQFEMLADAARAGKIRVAPRLFVLAARANWRAGRIPHGMQLLRNGLGILVSAGALEAARRIASSAADELETLGLAEEAEEARKFLSEMPAATGNGTVAVAPAAAVRPLLPTHCGQCGAAVHTDEVEWMDEQTAECAYCGSPIRPETD
jgi:hypothetical protein